MSKASVAAKNIRITLPDGGVKTFVAPITPAEIAASIGPGLAKGALAAKIDGVLSDLDLPITRDATLSIVTRKDESALELIRHDAAHILAMAVQELFPGTQVTIGPVIEDGFYYDFSRNEPFHPEDLPRIEARMKEIVDRDLPTRREVCKRDEAAAHFKSLGEHYKAELIAAIPEGEEVRIYHHGPWHDLCRGPHLPSTGKIGKGFKLTKIAGAYWRGDARNAQLQRVYGTAWRDEKELADYLHRVEEAEKRDHRKLGREMDLFHIQEEAKGMIFWHPKGWTLYRTLVSYMRRRIEAAGYVEVKTPQIMDRSMWERSGHWEKFRDSMFVSETPEGEVLAVKPMNCPGHIQIFNQGIKSYRDLPVRIAEFDGLHRCEASGAVHGTMRVRQMAQDDAHIFCREDQIDEETIAFVQLLKSVYQELGVELHAVKLALRPELRAGTDATWDLAEAKLEKAARAAGLNYEILPGEGGFYAPKLEFHLRDAIGRTWQCGTIQLDMVLPERFDASYIGEDGQKHRPMMLHRAIFGSIERFIGILIEHYAGRLPLWLAPVQVVVATITSDAEAYAKEAAARLKAEGLRVTLDLRNEKINYKVREHSLAKVPFIAVAGRREAEERTLSLRRLGGDAQQTLALEQVVPMLKVEAQPPDLRRAG